jgi:hypothetical protein
MERVRKLATSYREEPVSLLSACSHTYARRIAAFAAAVAGILATASSAEAGIRLVAPAGSDSGTCAAVPCASLGYAYGQAASGDVITVAPGIYGPQRVPGGAKAVTFRGLPGNKIRQLMSDADNVTYDGLDLDAGGAKTDGAVFETGGASRVTFRNGRIGNVMDQKGALFGGQESPASLHTVIDNVVFHDVMYSGNGDVHQECVFSQTAGLTLRNSTFTNCSTMDISLNRGDWWGQQPYGNVTIENNVFGHSTNQGGWHHYGLAWFVDAFKNARVVNNTFENAVLLETSHAGSAPYTGVWANNVGGGWTCLPGVIYRNNLGTACHSSDRRLSPSSSCAPPACGSRQTVPVGWVNPTRGDFTLLPNSIAVNAGNPTYAPRTDKRGLPRDARPDAGAYEFGVGGGSGPPAQPGRRRPRIKFARLRPNVICKPARRGCPSTARLKLRLSRKARVSVAIQRVRSGHKPKRVRRMGLPKRRKLGTRLHARSLHRGRYRLKIVASNLGGRSKPKFLKLTVR